MWPKPGKEPHQDVDGTVVVSIHHESTFRAMVYPFPLWHGFEVTTATTGLGHVALIYELEIFPVQQAFVVEHLNKSGEPPIVEDGSVQVRAAFTTLTSDHLPLTYISYHNGSFNQFVGDQMTRFVQTVLLFIPFSL